MKGKKMAEIKYLANDNFEKDLMELLEKYEYLIVNKNCEDPRCRSCEAYAAEGSKGYIQCWGNPLG